MEAINEEIILFSLIFMRMFGFILLNPIFGRKNIASIIKAGFTLTLTILVFMITQGSEVIEIQSTIEYVVLMLKEFAIGYLLGFVMELFFFTLTYAGAVIDFQIGLSMATIYDPQNGAQVALTGNILNIYAMLLFFATDGHLALMKILVQSAEVVPFGKVGLSPSAPGAVLHIFQENIILAVKIAFPMIAVIFLTEAAVGILMKMIPQINIFVLSIQVKIILGLTIMMFLISPMGEIIETMLIDMVNTMQEMLKMTQG